VETNLAGRLSRMLLLPNRTPLPTRRKRRDGNDEENRTAREKKKKKREYYDTSDPFINNSELAIDERTWFSQTKQQAFYVSSGEVALAKDNKGVGDAAGGRFLFFFRG
jgi:hypothetical protein